MDIFKLPDLGEGLPDAEIHEWYVQEGDQVALDQPLVSMETAKAVVDVPSPQAGIIAKLYGKPGDVIKTGEPLIAFAAVVAKADKGTVVGHLQESHQVGPDDFVIGAAGGKTRNKATPAVKMLAKKLNVDIHSLQGTGDHGTVTREDVQREADKQAAPPEGFEPLKGVRRAMFNSMVQSHQEVVPVSIFDEADLSQWPEKTDITVRLIQSIVSACQQEPALNAWFDTKRVARRLLAEVNLGLAMDNEEGLFVPVIHQVAQYDEKALRGLINELKTDVQNRTIAAEKLKGATITLSNFGKFAGRFASPIIVPPMVAIIAAGRMYQKPVCVGNQVVSHLTLPLSLSFDHRAVTGGEATRFLGILIEALEKP